MLRDELLELKSAIAEYKNKDVLTECVKERLDTSFKVYSQQLVEDYEMIKDKSKRKIIKALKREL